LSPYDDVQIIVLVSLPRGYPTSSAPQLQLLSRYIGAFAADPGLFGFVLRTFISVNGIGWTPDTVCVFDGLQNVIERCTDWYKDRIGQEANVDPDVTCTAAPTLDSVHLDHVLPVAQTLPPTLEGIEIFEAESIIDRKSVFVGRACRILHPDQARPSSSRRYPP
jgi:hypothetical protein